jgi:uncharacterized protein (DUF488 family)
MSTLYTIGYKGKPLQAFIEQLQAAGIDAIVDVRLRNTSHLLGYTKRNDLAFLLRAGFGIRYEHCPQLAPTDEILLAYRQDSDWPAYVDRFAPLLVERRAEDLGRRLLAHYRSPCLLCAETTPEQCHRRLIAEYLARQIPSLHIRHL